jgi:hypothetical protein
LIDQHCEAFVEAELGDVGLLGLGAEGFSHAQQTQGPEFLQGLLIQHKGSLAEAGPA